MITVIAPHARPEFAANLLANSVRQKVKHHLVVVENGAALGSFAAREGVTVVSSAVAHQAAARNAGLTWLRANGGGAWAMFDDDDYYGADYLSDVEHALSSSGAVAVGKPWSFVMFDDGLWRFSKGKEHCWADSFSLTGGSLAGASTDVVEFPTRPDDDVGWCAAMRARGARLWSGSPFHYCYDRRGNRRDRAIPGAQVIIRFGFGAADFYGQQPFEACSREGLLPLRHVPAPTDLEVFEALARGCV
jgi:hypothetical protein